MESISTDLSIKPYGPVRPTHGPIFFRKDCQ
nr:MAG TPA: hypothetical protein [Caudoviricetes sp.]